MPYDPDLAQRLAAMVEHLPGMEHKKMFGGWSYHLNGNMCVGVHKDCLMMRMGEERAALILDDPGVKPMDFTGKVMKGWVTAMPAALEDDAAMRRYVELAIEYVSTLPPKNG